MVVGVKETQRGDAKTQEMHQRHASNDNVATCVDSHPNDGLDKLNKAGGEEARRVEAGRSHKGTKSRGVFHDDGDVRHDLRNATYDEAARAALVVNIGGTAVGQTGTRL